MMDEFSSTIPQKFPTTVNNKDPIERPWDVTETRSGAALKRLGEESKRDELGDRIDSLYSELRTSLTVRAALEYDLKKASHVLEEVSRIKTEVEKIVEMLRVMEEYMKERVK